MKSELEDLNARLERLHAEVATVQHANVTMRAEVATVSIELATVRQQNQHERRKLRVQTGLAFASLLFSLFALPGNRAAIAQGYGVTLATLNTRLTAVEAKTQYMSADSTAQSTTFSGCNVIVNDGGGSTSAVVTNPVGQGVGNLIIGYNALRNDGSDLRIGSHNLILGDYQDYSSYGGFAAGIYSTITGPYASVSGGYGNTASGKWSSTSGGAGNTASAPAASVSGGAGNVASGEWSSVSGGYSNSVSGAYASISGGTYNTASGDSSSISGGCENIASGIYGSISGGVGNTASNQCASISGGQGITQSNPFGWSGGSYNTP